MLSCVAAWLLRHTGSHKSKRASVRTDEKLRRTQPTCDDIIIFFWERVIFRAAGYFIVTCAFQDCFSKILAMVVGVMARQSCGQGLSMLFCGLCCDPCETSISSSNHIRSSQSAVIRAHTKQTCVGVSWCFSKVFSLNMRSCLDCSQKEAMSSTMSNYLHK